MVMSCLTILNILKISGSRIQREKYETSFAISFNESSTSWCYRGAILSPVLFYLFDPGLQFYF